MAQDEYLSLNVEDPDETRVRLARIGFDRVVGTLEDPSEVFTTRPELCERSSRLTIEQLAEARNLEPDLQLVDVRNPGETRSGTLAGALEIPLAALTDSLDALDRKRPVVVYCAGGYRSSIAASVLRAAGFDDVSDLLGGYGAWEGAGLPVSHEGGGSTAGEEAGTAMAMTRGPAVPEMTATEAADAVAAGAVLLDVREPDEWEAGHAPAAVHVPMAQVQARSGELAADRRIVAVCRSGGRSAAVTEALLAWGFDAVNVAGGMRAWEAAQLPVITADGQPGVVA